MNDLDFIIEELEKMRDIIKGAGSLDGLAISVVDLCEILRRLRKKQWELDDIQKEMKEANKRMGWELARVYSDLSANFPPDYLTLLRMIKGEGDV